MRYQCSFQMIVHISLSHARLMRFMPILQYKIPNLSIKSHLPKMLYNHKADTRALQIPFISLIIPQYTRKAALPSARVPTRQKSSRIGTPSDPPPGARTGKGPASRRPFFFGSIPACDERAHRFTLSGRRIRERNSPEHGHRCNSGNRPRALAVRR